MAEYARVVVEGSPISKSNFKLSNKAGRSILPSNSGTYHDRYFEYEERIVIAAKSQNPDVVFTESLIAVLKVYYKSDKRHPDTNNITKSIFDGIEKSGLIVNDAQVRRLIIEEYYDKNNPRFELELFPESVFRMSYEVRRHNMDEAPIEYGPPANKKRIEFPGKKRTGPERMVSPGRKLSAREKPMEDKDSTSEILKKELSDLKKGKAVISAQTLKATSDRMTSIKDTADRKCSICGKKVSRGEYVLGNGGRDVICKKCLSKAL